MYKNVLAKIASEVEEKNAPMDFPIKIIAIDGRGGAGKSTLANELGQTLGVEILHTDDFASWNDSINWWPRFIKEVIEPIKSGAKKLNYKRSKWSEDHNPGPVRNQPITSIMILEGVRSSRKELRPFLTYAIWVDTPIKVCLKRGLERDGPSTKAQWEKWFEEEDEYIKHDDPIGYANLKVSGEGNT
jgi:uridine kinase